jgi:hypothetical protein
VARERERERERETARRGEAIRIDLQPGDRIGGPDRFVRRVLLRVVNLGGVNSRRQDSR